MTNHPSSLRSKRALPTLLLALFVLGGASHCSKVDDGVSPSNAWSCLHNACDVDFATSVPTGTGTQRGSGRGVRVASPELDLSAARPADPTVCPLTDSADPPPAGFPAPVDIRGADFSQQVY